LLFSNVPPRGLRPPWICNISLSDHYIFYEKMQKHFSIPKTLLSFCYFQEWKHKIENHYIFNSGFWFYLMGW